MGLLVGIDAVADDAGDMSSVLGWVPVCDEEWLRSPEANLLSTAGLDRAPLRLFSDS